MAFILKSLLSISPQCHSKGELSDRTTLVLPNSKTSLGVPHFPSNLPPTQLNGVVIL